jgi:hypothetical protein
MNCWLGIFPLCEAKGRVKGLGTNKSRCGILTILTPNFRNQPGMPMCAEVIHNCDLNFCPAPIGGLFCSAAL